MWFGCLCNVTLYIGENRSFFSVFPVTIRNAGRYYCQVKNQYGAVSSTIAMVVVTSSPTSQPPSNSSGFTYSPLITDVVCNKKSTDLES